MAQDREEAVLGPVGRLGLRAGLLFGGEQTFPLLFVPSLVGEPMVMLAKASEGSPTPPPPGRPLLTFSCSALWLTLWVCPWKASAC